MPTLLEKDGTSTYVADLRSRLKAFTDSKFKKDATVFNAAMEIEDSCSRPERGAPVSRDGRL